MKLSKIYWKTKNYAEVAVIKARKNTLNTGLLSHRKDKRDFEYLGGWFEAVKPRNENVFLANDWIFDQKYLNICVFASNVLSSSYQEDKRFSVKFAVQMAKKQGHITGNGFSFLRAALDIAVKYGRLPYEMMPDEVNCTWEQYSKYQITDDMLAEAAKWKAPSYKKVKTLGDAVSLLDNEYSLLTGIEWWTAMNYPQKPDSYLNFAGRKIGGHAIGVHGYRAPQFRLKDFVNVNTFGQQFGDNGLDRLRAIFARGFFDVYMMEKINS